MNTVARSISQPQQSQGLPARSANVVSAGSSSGLLRTASDFAAYQHSSSSQVPVPRPPPFASPRASLTSTRSTPVRQSTPQASPPVVSRPVVVQVARPVQGAEAPEKSNSCIVPACNAVANISRAEHEESQPLRQDALASQKLVEELLRQDRGRQEQIQSFSEELKTLAERCQEESTLRNSQVRALRAELQCIEVKLDKISNHVLGALRTSANPRRVPYDESCFRSKLDALAESFGEDCSELPRLEELLSSNAGAPVPAAGRSMVEQVAEVFSKLHDNVIFERQARENAIADIWAEVSGLRGKGVQRQDTSSEVAIQTIEAIAARLSALEEDRDTRADLQLSTGASVAEMREGVLEVCASLGAQVQALAADIARERERDRVNDFCGGVSEFSVSVSATAVERQCSGSSDATIAPLCTSALGELRSWLAAELERHRGEATVAVGAYRERLRQMEHDAESQGAKVPRGQHRVASLADLPRYGASGTEAARFAAGAEAEVCDEAHTPAYIKPGRHGDADEPEAKKVTL